MTDAPKPITSPGRIIEANLRRRRRAETRFRLYGISAVVFAVFCLVVLLGTIVSNALPAFSQTMIRLDVDFQRQVIDPKGSNDPEVFAQANYRTLIKASLSKLFPEVRGRRDTRNLTRLISSGAIFTLRDEVLADASVIGKAKPVWVLASADLDQYNKGGISLKDATTNRRVGNQQAVWFEHLKQQGRVKRVFNTTLFTAGDSREPELAGVWGAIVGSFYTLLVTLALSFPIGVASAVYLEEFAPKNALTHLIEVNINNLAAVPSIVFGLLGLAVFLNFFNLPRSAPLVGGMVMALMTMPTIIIAGRSALKSVPPSLREAAFGLGATKLQMVTDHALPLAMPGILTGTIIGMARALGETAPLLMIGMVAFIVDIPGGVTDPATVMPVQIYLWADSPEHAFIERTAAATLILVGFLIAMNGFAVVLRKKFERKW